MGWDFAYSLAIGLEDTPLIDNHFQNERNFFENIDEHRKLRYDYKLT